MTRLIVATRPGVERPATRQEVCRHSMIDTGASSGGRRHQRCSKCGKGGMRPMGPGESIFR